VRSIEGVLNGGYNMTKVGGGGRGGQAVGISLFLVSFTFMGEPTYLAISYACRVTLVLFFFF
jgi:hypothetical protein